jgi:hypothetical protein
LLHVELEVAQEDHLAGDGFGKRGFEQLKDVQRIGADGESAFLYVNQALGGGPDMETVVEVVADGGDFRFGTGLFGTDDDETGIAGVKIRPRRVPSASSIALVAASQPLPWNPSASTVISPRGETRTWMRRFTGNLLPA